MIPPFCSHLCLIITLWSSWSCSWCFFLFHLLLSLIHILGSWLVWVEPKLVFPLPFMAFHSLILSLMVFLLILLVSLARERYRFHTHIACYRKIHVMTTSKYHFRGHSIFHVMTEYRDVEDDVQSLDNVCWYTFCVRETCTYNPGVDFIFSCLSKKIVNLIMRRSIPDSLL